MVLDEEHAVKAERLSLANILYVIGIDPAVARLLAELGPRAAE